MTSADERERHSLSQLRIRLLGFVGLTLVSTIVVALLLPEGARSRFFIGAAMASGAIFVYIWNRLSQNRLAERSEASGATRARLLPVFGWGTSLTLLRATALGILAGFVLVPRPADIAGWWPAVLYLIVALGDGLDGYLARRNNQSTLLGATLDLELDSLGTLIAILVAIQFGQLPLWFLAVALARYLFVFAASMRAARGYPVYELTSSRHRRTLAGFQMGFLVAALFPPTSWPYLPAEGVKTAAIAFGGLTLIGFVRDWLVLSGAIDPASFDYRRYRDALSRTIPARTLPLCRALVAGWALGQAILLFGSGADQARLFGLLVFVAAGALLLGVASRLAALALAFLFAHHFNSGAAGPMSHLLVLADMLVVILGPGDWALWSPEEALLSREHTTSTVSGVSKPQEQTDGFASIQQDRRA